MRNEPLVNSIATTSTMYERPNDEECDGCPPANVEAMIGDISQIVQCESEIFQTTGVGDELIVAQKRNKHKQTTLTAMVRCQSHSQGASLS
jgi:hypothetical protein